MMKPTLHLNGTSREELQRQLDAASDACREAMQALMAAAPNGRDYYPQGYDALGEAFREHTARLQKLADVRNDIEVLREHVT